VFNKSAAAAAHDGRVVVVSVCLCLCVSGHGTIKRTNIINKTKTQIIKQTKMNERDRQE
jgi:hypothetical protein